MKAIINGKRYDTEKATLIGSASSDAGRSDFRFFREELYVTPRSGRYFVAGEGGAMSRWAQRVDKNGYTGGKGILPLTREDALMWAEQHLPADIIELHFSDMVEDA
jgi:hypothetical protein